MCQGHPPQSFCRAEPWGASDPYSEEVHLRTKLPCNLAEEHLPRAATPLFRLRRWWVGTGYPTCTTRGRRFYSSHRSRQLPWAKPSCATRRDRPPGTPLQFVSALLQAIKPGSPLPTAIRRESLCLWLPASPTPHLCAPQQWWDWHPCRA